MTEKKPPIYYVVLNTLKAYEQANYASGKRKREADKRKRETDKRKEGIWTKALIQSDGDEKKTKIA